jgi:UDP-N-acetylenolpyruvoylglucosamine reductase
MNIGGANGEDFFNLCNEIKEKVFEKMGIKINEEVVYVE